MKSHGYDVFETDKGLQIQIEDELSPYDNDRDATIACINDCLGGDLIAAEMLKRVLTKNIFIIHFRYNFNEKNKRKISMLRYNNH